MIYWIKRIQENLPATAMGEVQVWNVIKDGTEERKFGGEEHEFKEA